jgi:feruloyl esterase
MHKLNLIHLSFLIIFASSNVTGRPFSAAGDSASQYAQPSYQATHSCKSLVERSDYQFTIVDATLIEAKNGVPAHCRIDGLIPTEIRFELNLPLNWNGRIYMYGNGGLAGTPAVDRGKQYARDQALKKAFATAYTDTGHDKRVTPGGTFAHNNFHKLVDYGFRAVHLTIKTSKLLAKHYYNHKVNFSYWNGCSTGGRQAMISAQRFPADFDGIVAGAPAANYSGLKFSQAWRTQAIGQSTLTEAKVALLANIIYEACDTLDGHKDGLISDPRRCDFKPNRDLPRCSSQETVSNNCFSISEINALEKYYSPVKIQNHQIYPAMPVGSEILSSNTPSARTGWYPWVINADGRTLFDALGSDFFRYMVTIKDDPSYDWNEFTFETLPDNLAEFSTIVDAIDPDLSRFKDRGGKLLSYFGWADPDINPLTLINYLEQVKNVDPDATDYFRVFLVPGMFHCRGGPGPDSFDMISPLIDWVERKIPPETIPAWKEVDGARIYSRPLCVYPDEALPSENGFHCEMPQDLLH